MAAAPVPRQHRSHHVFPGSPCSESVSIHGLLARAVLAVSAFFALAVIAALLFASSPTLSRSLRAFFVRNQTGVIQWNGTDPVNMVIAGVDRWRVSNPSPPTRAVVVVSVDPANHVVHMLSIPRNLWVNVPGHGYDRIRDAYAEGGDNVLMQTVEGVVNMPIRYYAVVNLTGIQRSIGSLEGVTTDVKDAVATDFPYDDLRLLSRVVTGSHVQHRFLNEANNSVVDFVTSGGGAILQPNWTRIHWIAHQSFRDPRLTSSPIEVLNGSGLPGQAGALAQWMHACGFRITRVENAAGQAHTQVIRNLALPGSDYVARMAANLLDTRAVFRSVRGATAPVVVIAGLDWVDPAQS